MKTSENGIDFIKNFEGFRAMPYQDYSGFNTIGYGHKIVLGEMCDSVTPEEAERMLADDLLYAEDAINHNVTAPLNQNQFDALVSFVYNVGPGHKSVKDGFVILKSGNPSTMLRRLNMGDYAGCAAQFPNWDHADGVEVDGLRDRRIREMDLFLEPVDA